MTVDPLDDSALGRCQHWHSSDWSDNLKTHPDTLIIHVPEKAPKKVSDYWTSQGLVGQDLKNIL